MTPDSVYFVSRSLIRLSYLACLMTTHLAFLEIEKLENEILRNHDK